MITNGALRLSVGEVFTARIIRSIPNPDDEPPTIYIYPRWYEFEPTDPTGQPMPIGAWHMDPDQCKIKFETEDGYFAARNSCELYRRDQDLRYLPVPNGMPVQMMFIRMPELTDVQEGCTPIIIPNIESAPPPMFMFHHWVDPLSTYCDCEDGEPCPPD